MRTYTEAYEFLLSVIGNVPYGVIAIDMDGYITMLNDEALQNINIQLAVKKVLETNILDYVSNIPELEEELQNCFKKGRKAFELKGIFYHDKYLNFKIKPILNGMLISINDVTATKKAQDAATLALLEGQEMERRRLAKEIHDGIGPLMSTIRLNLDGVKTELAHTSSKTLQKVNNMGQLVQQVATDIRQISHALMPSALIDFGIVEAIEHLCSKIDDSEMLQIEFFHKGIDGRLAPNIELNIYRIIQELLNNSLKYAEAKYIQIQMVQRNKKIVLTVEDDGLGFDQNAIPNGIGLRNIQTRVNLLNGYFTFDTQKGKGVFSTVEIPV